MKKLITRLELLSWQLGPAALTLLLSFISYLPKRINLFADYTPLFAVIAIYYWSLFKPAFLPYWFLFLLGLAQDALLGMPLGSSSLVFILFKMMVGSQSRVFAREKFWGMWVGFLLLSITVFCFYWMVVSFANKYPMPLLAATAQWALTAAFYPSIHLLFNYMYASIPEKRL